MAIQFIEQNRKPTFLEQLGTGIEGFQSGFKEAKEKQLKERRNLAYSKLLRGEELDEEEQKILPLEAQAKAAEISKKNYSEQLKEKKEKEESRILGKKRRGEELTLEEEESLSPASHRSLLTQEKPVFEQESEKLAAQRASKSATEIENDYEAYQVEDLRLRKQERLAESKNLPTPMMVKTLETFGIPLSVLGNPQGEEYAKIEADYVRDVSKVFPGQIRVYEIQAYLKTVPTLMNSDEGKKSIIQNRKILNEAKKIRYEAYKKIMKGRSVPPHNLNLQINDMVREDMIDLADKYVEGIQDTLNKYGPTVPMRGPNGEIADIPAYGIVPSQQQGWTIITEE